MYRRLEDENTRLRAENAALKQPLTDEDIHEFYSGECESGVSFDFLRRFQAFIAKVAVGEAQPYKEPK